MNPLRWLALIVCACLGVGCASAQKDTMTAEFALSSATSLCFKTIDGVDQVVTDRIRVKLLNGDHQGATYDHGYRPHGRQRTHSPFRVAKFAGRLIKVVVYL